MAVIRRRLLLVKSCDAFDVPCVNTTAAMSLAAMFSCTNFFAIALTLIALTGWGQEEDRYRSQLAGFDFHLIKPVDVNTLQHLLVSVDQRSEPRRH